MCILFLYTDENPKPGHFKIILAANRDENFKRPSKPAEFWNTTPNIIGGRDNVNGREGGTWLAMNSAGKIGVLLNILTRTTGEPSNDKLGRGFLVNNFLMSDIGGLEYASALHKSPHVYNPFNLVSIEILNGDKIQISYYSNEFSKSPIQLKSKGVHGFGNSVLDVPFEKIKEGKEIFKTIIENHGTENQKHVLIEKLTSLLQSTKRFENDAQILAQRPRTYNEEEVKALSSNFINIPSKEFGTRTHTLITVNCANEVEFHELTMEEPILDSSRANWNHASFQFKLDIGDISNTVKNGMRAKL